MWEQDNVKAITVTLKANNMQFNDCDRFQSNFDLVFGERAVGMFRFTYRLITTASSARRT